MADYLQCLEMPSLSDTAFSNSTCASACRPVGGAADCEVQRGRHLEETPAAVWKPHGRLKSRLSRPALSGGGRVVTAQHASPLIATAYSPRDMSSNCTNAAAAVSASKTKTKKKHFIGQKVKLFRASEPILSVLMWGVNHTINELSNVPVPVMLMPDDFKAYSKIKVDNHLFNKENLPSRFKFKEYCPMVFRNLRERFSIDDQDYQNSLTRSAPLNSDSQGRFGNRFLSSYDHRFVIKTVSSEDIAEMHNILKKYHQFIVECHGNTLLPQFLGMYRLTVDGVETYMVVTRNVFSHRLSVHRKYDLKGSTVSREASDKEKVRFFWCVDSWWYEVTKINAPSSTL
uniref:1-phosphatidylinositol-5-phosphate 4-kinase n=1 Tax=Knipowitschia caucasica TaxID=637954 RepID=A0AAV2LS55_KNICA